MSALPSPFHYRRQYDAAAQDIAHVSEAAGFRRGYKTGFRNALRIALYAWVVIGWLIFVPLAIYLTFGG